jgi:hypothetical protein
LQVTRRNAEWRAKATEADLIVLGAAIDRLPGGRSCIAFMARASADYESTAATGDGGASDARGLDFRRQCALYTGIAPDGGRIAAVRINMSYQITAP